MLVLCDNCGKDFDKGSSQIRATNHNFCCRSCAAIFNNETVPKRHRSKRCIKCGDLVLSDRLLCDACGPRQLTWLDITLGDIKKRYNYQKHGRVREFARRLFKRLGRGSTCERCGYDKHTDICHYPKSIASFSQNSLLKDINTPSNLLAFCRNCHWELDHGLIPKEELDTIRDNIVIPTTTVWRGHTIVW